MATENIVKSEELHYNYQLIPHLAPLFLQKVCDSTCKTIIPIHSSRPSAAPIGGRHNNGYHETLHFYQFCCELHQLQSCITHSFNK